jgi:hypothetical protein
MTEHAFFQPVSDQSPFRQGDVIRRDITPRGEGQPATAEWGVIITADCDIAQEKMGEFFTYLVIRSARDYIEQVWASEEISKLVDRHGHVAVEHILKADQARDPNATPLTFAELSEWVRADGAEAVLNAVKISQAAIRKKVATALEVLTLADDQTRNSMPLERLRACWAREGKKEPEHRGLIRNALSQRQMRSDYMLTPTLPSETEVGFVVMLRDIRAIKPSDLFASRLDLRIGNGSASAMYRIGRFSDFIRYAIAQRMANLFSRIGMTEQFETECEVAAGLTLETLIPCAGQTED